MKGSKEILEELQQGEEYVNALMPLWVYNEIDHRLHEEMSITIRQKHCLYDTDPTYRELAKQSKQASKKLSDYEFEKLH